MPPNTRILIAHSGVTRALARGDYRDRVDECERTMAAARAAGLAGPEVTVKNPKATSSTGTVIPSSYDCFIRKSFPFFLIRR